MLIDLEQKGTGSMESRTVTICSGLDFVNINYTPMIARDPDCAKVRDITFTVTFQAYVKYCNFYGYKNDIFLV